MASRIEQWQTVGDLLAEARSGLVRLTPRQAATAMEAGAQLVDIRADHQRHGDGLIPGAHVIARNVLEWRLDPASPHRDQRLASRELRLLLICNEGYQSSLAAAAIRCFGLDATDVVGGFQAWRESGLPIVGATRHDDPSAWRRPQ